MGNVQVSSRELSLRNSFQIFHFVSTNSFLVSNLIKCSVDAHGLLISHVCCWQMCVSCIMCALFVHSSLDTDCGHCRRPVLLLRLVLHFCFCGFCSRLFFTSSNSFIIFESICFLRTLRESISMHLLQILVKMLPGYFFPSSYMKISEVSPSYRQSLILPLV